MVLANTEETPEPAPVAEEQTSTPVDETQIDTGDAVSGLKLESEINTNVVEANTEEEPSDQEDTMDETDTIIDVAEDTETASTTDSTDSEEKTNENATSSVDINTSTTLAATTTENTTEEGGEEVHQNATSTDQVEIPATPTASTTSTSSDPVIEDPEDTDTDETVVEVDLTNSATSSNTATSSANTGGNTTESGNFEINTGDAVSYVDLVNVVNTNIINSTGLIDFIRNVLGYQNFDLRSNFYDIFKSFKTAESSPSCAYDICDPASLLVDIMNDVNINNNIDVIANTGGNSSSGDNGSIDTGTAYASANIVNLANTNIIDSNYLLLTFDNFADLAGSLVLPNSDFFTSLFANNTGGASSYEISNTASVTNDVTTIANTGDNTTSSTEEASITTGNAQAISHTDNLINQNLLNTNSFSMLIRVHGTWSGEIFGLPEGMQWENTGEGIRLYYAPNSQPGAASSAGKITNNATIANNVHVYALTGDNQINDSETGTIETGDAYANSTIVNVANTNVIGSNWANLIFNIYGNWSGNLAFGQPDLWLGLEANTGYRSQVKPGSQIDYKYTIFNGGDTVARNVIVENKFPLNSLYFTDSPVDADDIDNQTHWAIGDIEPGETREFTVHTRTHETFGLNDRLPLPLSSRVYGDQPDANDTDNEDSLLLYVGEKQKQHEGPSKTFAAKFSVAKSADKAFVAPGDTVNYTVKLHSLGGPLFDSLLVDVLRDEEGNVLSEQSWPLDTIKNGEEITIDYSIIIPEGATGVFTNTAQLIGVHGTKQPKYRTLYESTPVEHKLMIGSLAEAELLGLNTTVSTCDPYITTYLRQNKVNNTEEVIKLQQFLKSHISDNVLITGVFDDATRVAVAEFQQQYKEDILIPWGMTRSSGYVYITTQKTINEIMCGNITKFPLTPDQQQEIDFFRINKNQIDVTDWLFSGPVSTPEEDLAEQNPVNESIATKVYPTSILNLTLPPIEQAAVYDRYGNWLRLFNQSHTAYLDY